MKEHHCALLRGAHTTLGLALVMLYLTGAASAQPFPRPRLDAVTPAGARVGTTVEVSLAGAELDEPSSLYFSDRRIKAERLSAPPPPTDKTKPPPSAPLRFKVTVPTDAPIGIHDVRFIGKWGISNPRAFVVGDLAEMIEKEANDDAPQAQKVALQTTVTGTVASPSDVDYYGFPGKKGQRVVVFCAASSIDSRLNPLLKLIGPDGAELHASRNYRNRDAVLDAALPADGDYLVRVCHFTYTFGKPEQSFYRLSISTAPWIDAVYPPAVEAGKANLITFFGRNLPQGKPANLLSATSGVAFESVQIQLTPSADLMPTQLAPLLPRAGTVDTIEHRLRTETGTSNAILLARVQGQIVLDTGDNDSPDKAQAVELPCSVCGRIEGKRDQDWFRFRAKQGEVFIVEGFGDRLGTPVDLYVKLRRADNGATVGEFDGHAGIPSRVGQLWTHTDDPLGRFVVPAEGEYQLLVGSWIASSRSGPRATYCVNIRREEPGFRLLLVDLAEGGGGFTLNRGGHQDLQVVCLRQDGFEGEVLLEAEGLPAGVICPPQVIGPKVTEATLVLSARSDAAFSAGEVRIKGTAKIGKAEVVRQARASTLVWPMPQKNVPAFSRLTRSICLAVRDKGPFTLSTATGDLALPLGGKAELTVRVNRQWSDFKAAVQLTRLSAPVQSNGQFINVPAVTVPAGKGEGSVKFQVSANTPPGSYSLVLQGKGKLSYQFDPKSKQKKTVDAVEVTPPVRVTVYDSVAELSIAPGEVALRSGTEVPVTVQVKRLHDFKGFLKLDVVPPSGVQGVSATSVTIPAGANEAKLFLRASKEAKPATSPNFLVRATATVEGIALKSEASFKVTVSPNATTPGVSGSVKTVPLLPAGSAGWKCLAAAKVKGDAWTSPAFDDRSWTVAKAPVGYGEQEIATRKGTTITDKGQAVLCRRELDVPAELLSRKDVILRLTVASDDSAVVYVNGKLVDEDPMGDHEFAYWNREVTLQPGQLRAGKNAIAVRVNNGSGSSDLYFDLAVTALHPESKTSKK